jgi:hypothetical protein
LTSRRAEYAEEKKSGKSPIAGFTRCEIRPWMSSMIKAGGKVASDMARRVWGVDLEKIVRLIMMKAYTGVVRADVGVEAVY